MKKRGKRLKLELWIGVVPIVVISGCGNATGAGPTGSSSTSTTTRQETSSTPTSTAAEAIASKKAQEEEARRGKAEQLAEYKKKVHFISFADLELASEHRQCLSNKQPPEWVACREAGTGHKEGDAAACEAVARAAGCEVEKEKRNTWCCPRIPVTAGSRWTAPK